MNHKLYINSGLRKYILITFLSTLSFQQYTYAETGDIKKSALETASNTSSNITTEGFVKGTQVLTVNKQTSKQELKNIESIQLGDTVVTSTVSSKD